MNKKTKTKAEMIQRKISIRLKKMKKEGLKPEDFKYLWDWTHELYKRAKNQEALEGKLDEIESLIEEAKKEIRNGK